MKRAHLPAYSSVAPQRAAVPPVIIGLRPVEYQVTEPVPQWPYREIGSVVLSFPRDLRPRPIAIEQD